jgi:hypothetical protein
MKQVQERLIRDEVSQSQTLICEPAPHGPQLPYYWLSALSFAKLIPLMFLRMGLGVCASCLFLGTAWAQEDPLDKPFTQPLYLIHITGTGTINGPTKRDDYMLYPAPPDNKGILITPDGEGGTFTNSAELVGGPFKTLREACGAAQGLPKALSSLGCPNVAAPGGKKNEGGGGILSWVVYGGGKRFSDGWDSLTARDASIGERVVGGLSLTGGIAELVLLGVFIGGAVKGGAAALRGIRGLMTGGEVATEVGGKVLAERAAQEIPRVAERIATQIGEIAKGASTNLTTGQVMGVIEPRIQGLVNLMRQAGVELSTENAVRIIDGAGNLSAEARAKLLEVLENTYGYLFTTPK